MRSSAALRRPIRACTNPAVAEIDLRRLDRLFAEVLLPPFRLPHHVRLPRPVEGAPDGAFVDTERARGVRRIPHRAVNVRGHHPEAAHRRHGDVDAQQRQGAGEKELDEPCAPFDALTVLRRQDRQRRSTAPPEVALLRGAELLQRGSVDLDNRDPPQQ